MWKTLVLLTLLIGSCQDKSPAGRFLRIDFQEGDLPSLHPHDFSIYLRGISIGKTLFEGLTRIDPDGQVQLAGAESVAVAPGGLQYTFRLRDNRWSNGEPVTAYQYEKAWKEALSPISCCSRADLFYLIKNGAEAKKGIVPLDSVGVVALDEKTLQVELAYPSPYFLELVSQPLFAPLSGSGCNGPFQVDSWKKGSLLRLKPNPYFWNRKQVSLPGIDIYMIQDISTVYSLYEKKKLDWIGLPLCPLTSELIANMNPKLKRHPVDRVFWIFLNTSHRSLSSPSIRQALSLALDRETITNHILVGGIPAPQLKDLVKAKAFFDQGMKELKLERFPPLSITYSQQANRKQLAEYLQETWSRAFGIDVHLQLQEWNVLRKNLEKGLFEISGCYETAFYKDPLELLERLAAFGPNNFPQWTDPLYREKIRSGMFETNPIERTKLLSDAEAILLDQMPIIPICSDCFLFAHPRNLKGYALDYIGAIDFSYASF